MDNIAMGICAVCALLALAAAMMERRRTGQTFDRIESMLNAAMENRFSETDWDETRLSALETKFACYLSSCAISAQNVAAERDKIKTLISDISHQTKTPIANLLLYSELLSEGGLPEKQKENAEAIHRQAEALRFLIDSLVKLSRLENGILTLSPAAGLVAPMLEAVCAGYTARAQEKGLYLRLQATDAAALFDAKWTGEAIGNIVDNAVKYTAAGGITVSASNYEMFVRIDIADTGIGMEEWEIPRVFARFYRAEAAREQEGVGVGLYLAREIIAAEGGYVKASSAPGRGAVFSVFLPSPLSQDV